MSRRGLMAGGLAVLAAAACEGPPTPTPPPSPGPSSSQRTPSPTPTGTPTVLPALTEPGEARKVVDELTRTANLPVIKVDITRTQVTLSALDGRTAKAWRWEAGRITEVESDIEFIQQSSFDPASFNLDDIGKLFEQAAEVTQSSTGQELQLVEQTPGSIMMVVTTRPESQPVFFRPDGSMVNRLDLRTRPGLEEALRDAIGGRTQLTRVELTRELLFAESIDPKDAEATLRISRPPNVPAFKTSRTDAPNLDSFSPTDIPLDIILEQVTSLPVKWNKPDGVVTWVVDRRDNRPLPTIRFSLGAETMVTDLEGRDITHEV